MGKSKKPTGFERLYNKYIKSGIYPKLERRPYTEKELKSFARALVDAAGYIAKEKPDTIIAPLRGSLPLVKGVQLALYHMKKYNPELRDYHPFIISPPNTGDKLRRLIGKIVGRNYSNLNAINELKRYKTLDDVKKHLGSINSKSSQVGKLVKHLIDAGEVEEVSDLVSQVEKFSRLNYPQFNKVLLLDEVVHGGALKENYRMLVSRGIAKKFLVVGIQHAPKGKSLIREKNSAVWKKAKLFKTEKIITMDKPTFLGVTYITKPTNKKTGEEVNGPVLYGIDVVSKQEKKKGYTISPSPHVFTIPAWRYGQFKSLMNVLDKEIDKIVKERYEPKRRAKGRLRRR